jgi:hypothetical protein
MRSRSIDRIGISEIGIGGISIADFAPGRLCRAYG